MKSFNIFGIEQSKQYKDVDSILEQVSDFIGRTNVWEGAEEEIVDRRNEYCIEDNNKGDLYEKLQKASEKEIEFQYSLWKKDLDIFRSILNITSST